MNRHVHHPTAGLTLLETVIAMTIFTVVMTMTIQAMMGMRSYIGMEESQNDLESVARGATMNMINDMANAGRFYSGNPAVLNFPLRTQDTVSTAKLRKDSLEFIRIRSSSTISQTPGSERYEFKNIEGGTRVHMDYPNYQNAPTIDYLLLDTTQLTNSEEMVKPVWEWYDNGAANHDAAANADPTKLRHVVYRVTNVASDGTGDLVRAYYNGRGSALPAYTSWATDQTLASHVSSFVVDTHETDATLNLNQIRFAIVLNESSSEVSTGITVSRRVEVTTAMRSITE